MNAPRSFHVIGGRPVKVAIDTRQIGVRDIEIPADWLIYNAPRPLYASPILYELREDKMVEVYPDWQGCFRHGIFYTAVAPDDVGRQDLNNKLDGWVLQYHTEAEAVEWAVKYYADKYHIPDIRELPHYEQHDAVVAFLDHMNKGETNG